MSVRRLASKSLMFAVLASACPASLAAAASPRQSDFDLRQTSPRAVVSPAIGDARSRLRSDLGPRALLSVEPASGRPRVLGRLDGALTGPSTDTGAEIALAYLRAHAAVYGLARSQIDDLAVGFQRRSGGGLLTVQLTQSHGGVKSIDSGVRAILDARGRLIELIGSPDPDLDAAATHAAVPRTRAKEIAAKASGRHDRADGANASAVIFHVGPVARLGWRVLVAAGPRQMDDILVDATSGAVLRRVNRVLSANAAGVYLAWPDAPLGGAPTAVDLAPYLEDPAAPTRLKGPNAYAFTDARDVVPGADLQLTPAPGSDIPPSAGTDFLYPFNGIALGGHRCPTIGPTCAWDPATPFSWQANREHDAVNLFWLVNSFHDHLAAPPIGFVASDGAFEDDDPILAQSMDGVDTASGIPDFSHLDNANFQTFPDGLPGLMQMYLWGGPPDPFFGADPFLSVSGSDDASIVYHEYTHGLSNRLVTDASGEGALDTLQAGAMGEAWSDWYGFDELDREGNLSDAPGIADVREGTYVSGPSDLIRTEPIDCPVGDADPACPGTPDARRGGYTFGDLGEILGFPEVHADGEIWAQTLWQLRDALIADHGRAAGIARVEQLVTDAMRMSPPEPSFLDQRNAILQADAIDAPAGQDADRIWEVFAARGMGWFASSDSADDVRVFQDFSLPPPPGAGRATVQGVVHEDGVGVPNVEVAFPGHDTGLGPDLAAVTDATGAYAITSVPPGTYPRLRAAVPASLIGGVAERVTVPASGILKHDFALRRNWAATAGGAAVRSFTGFDSFDCGPREALDGDPSTGWSSGAPSSANDPGPKEIVIALPADITLTGLAIDPSPVCGDFPAAELGDFRIKVAPDDEGDPGKLTTVATGRFAPADLGEAHEVALSSRPFGVRFVEVQALGNNGDPDFMDLAEIQVFGHRTTPEEVPVGPSAPEVTTLAADPAATTAGSVTFRAAVTPHGAPTVVRIQYGPAGGQLAFQTPDVPVVGDAPQTVAIGAAGLLPSMTYSHRAVAVNARGTATGGELTVKTAPLRPAIIPLHITAARNAGSVSCTRRGRTITCRFTARVTRVDGARARLSRNGHTYASGVVRGRVLRMRSRRALRPGSYILKVTKGHGRSAFVRRLTVTFRA